MAEVEANAEDGVAYYDIARRMLVSAKNGALVREGVDPADASAVVMQLDRFDAVVAVGEASILSAEGKKTRLLLVEPVRGWASSSLFVECKDVVARDDFAGTRRRAENLSAAGRYGACTVVCDNPLAFTIDNFATDAECARVIAAAEPYLAAALVAGDTKGVESGTSRSAQVAWVPRSPDAWLAKRVAEIINMPVSHAESLQVVKYGPLGEYRPHFDAFPLNSARGRRSAVRGKTYAGQRRVTAILYLNDVQEGGGTQFHSDTPDEFVVCRKRGPPTSRVFLETKPVRDREREIDRSYRRCCVGPKRGKLFVFHNCFEDGNDRHPMALHAGLPVLRGEKWIANLWWRSSPYQAATAGTLTATRGPA